MLRLALSLQSNRRTKHLRVFHCSPLINQHLEVKGSTSHFKPKRRVQSGLCTFPSYNALHNISDIYMSSAELTAAEALGSLCKHREHARPGHHIAFRNVQRLHNKVVSVQYVVVGASDPRSPVRLTESPLRLSPW